MLTELKAKSQLTIPKRIVDDMGLKQGDLFDVISAEGEIHLVPVVVWPKEKVEELQRAAAQARKELEDGSAKVYDDVDELIADLNGVAE